MLEDGRLKMQLPPQLAEMLNRLAKAAGLTPEGWIRAAIVAHGVKLRDPNDQSNRRLTSQNAAQSTIPHGTLLGSTDIDSD